MRPCPLDNCPIMLRASLLANVEILPQASQGSYFFNTIGREMPVAQLFMNRSNASLRESV